MTFASAELAATMSAVLDVAYAAGRQGNHALLTPIQVQQTAPRLLRYKQHDTVIDPSFMAHGDHSRDWIGLLKGM